MLALLEWPNWSTADWVSVLSTFWTAVAATAALVTIYLDRRRQQEAVMPNVMAGFAVPTSRVAKLVFGNGGPGMAVGLGFMGAHRDETHEYKYGGYVANGFLAAGGEYEVPVGAVAKRAGQAQFIWTCRDVRNNVHVWGYDGSYRRIEAKDWLAKKGPRKLGDFFTLVYPEIELPADTYATHQGLI